MANEAEKAGVVSSAEHTDIVVDPSVKAVGVQKVQDEIKHHTDASQEVGKHGVKVHGETTPMSVVTSELASEQFEEPKKYPVGDSRRWFGIFNRFEKKKSERRQNAA